MIRSYFSFKMYHKRQRKMIAVTLKNYFRKPLNIFINFFGNAQFFAVLQSFTLRAFVVFIPATPMEER